MRNYWLEQRAIKYEVKTWYAALYIYTTVGEIRILWSKPLERRLSWKAPHAQVIHGVCLVSRNGIVWRQDMMNSNLMPGDEVTIDFSAVTVNGKMLGEFFKD